MSAALPYRVEALRLYRSMMKHAARFPLRSRREIATEDVQILFRNAWVEADSWTKEEIEYKLSLAREKNEALGKFSTNMYWFHSRDEVNKEMLHFSMKRDQERIEEMERCNSVGRADQKNEDVTEFRSAYFQVHPDYYNKIEKNPLQGAQDLWLARGKYTSHIGSKQQRFYVKRYKPTLPNGW